MSLKAILIPPYLAEYSAQPPATRANNILDNHPRVEILDAL